MPFETVIEIKKIKQWLSDKALLNTVNSPGSSSYEPYLAALGYIQILESKLDYKYSDWKECYGKYPLKIEQLQNNQDLLENNLRHVFLNAREVKE